MTQDPAVYSAESMVSSHVYHMTFLKCMNTAFGNEPADPDAIRRSHCYDVKSGAVSYISLSRSQLRFIDKRNCVFVKKCTSEGSGDIEKNGRKGSEKGG